jgi:hypothetical protein
MSENRITAPVTLQGIALRASNTVTLNILKVFGFMDHKLPKKARIIRKAEILAQKELGIQYDPFNTSHMAIFTKHQHRIQSEFDGAYENSTHKNFAKQLDKLYQALSALKKILGKSAFDFLFHKIIYTQAYYDSL